MFEKLRLYEPLLMTLHRIGDALLGAALFLGLAWHFNMYTPSYSVVAVFILFIALVCFDKTGLYRSWRWAPTLSEIPNVLAGCFIIYIILLLLGYVLKVSSEFSRRVVLAWMIAWPALLALERFTARSVLRNYRSKGRNIRSVVIAGAGSLGSRMAQWIDDNLWTGTRLVGFFDDTTSEPQEGYPVLGNLEDLPRCVKNLNVDIVYLALPMRAEPQIKWLLQELADSTASIYFIPDTSSFDLLLAGGIMYFDNVPAIALRDSPFQGTNGVLKRLEDIVLASLILLLISPVMAAIAIGIKLTSKGPVIFRQWRYGLNGQPIEVFKFRTMTVCEDGYTFKQATKCDSRVTRLGSFLRRTSLDELPQFINVIQGRMSVVGPRPHPVALNEQFRKLVSGYMLRHKIKPGITGLSQVNGFRGETDTVEKMEKRIEYDLRYLRQWSLLLDLKIIFKTLFNGLSQKNAY